MLSAKFDGNAKKKYTVRNYRDKGELFVLEEVC